MTKKEHEEEICYICMDHYRMGTRVLTLPCKHTFCRRCVVKWLNENDTCPVCRYKFPENETEIIHNHSNGHSHRHSNSHSHNV